MTIRAWLVGKLCTEKLDTDQQLSLFNLVPDIIFEIQRGVIEIISEYVRVVAVLRPGTLFPERVFAFAVDVARPYDVLSDMHIPIPLVFVVSVYAECTIGFVYGAIHRSKPKSNFVVFIRALVCRSSG